MNHNSIEALKSSAETLSLRERVIFDTLLHRGAMTDREVKDALNYPDMNMVRPRINGLIAAGLVERARDVKCPVTHKTVLASCGQCASKLNRR